MTTVARPGHIAHQFVFLDGMTGTGKTMMAPILSTLARVEVQRIEHIYEYTCGLAHLGRLTPDGAQVLLRMYGDLAAYNVMIGRETNFRWKDLSGVLSNPGGWRYARRLFESDGDAVVERICREQPILQIVSHQVFGISAPMFEAFGDRLTVVEMVRHPLYLLRHWHSYISRHGADPRDFTIWIDAGGEFVPWFAAGWEDAYLRANAMDKVIRCIERLTELAGQALAALGDAGSRVLIVPFERFVTNPEPYLARVEQQLRTTRTPATTRELRRQKVPRRLTTDGRDLDIYRRYNWQPPDRDASEAAQLRKEWAFAAAEATPDGLARLEALCDRYEKGHLSEEPSLRTPDAGDEATGAA